jgi:hypothetical protein
MDAPTISNIQVLVLRPQATSFGSKASTLTA